jgi:drug/metabolite transporter (DMT)-like permease
MGNLFHTALWVFLILSLAIPFIGLKFDPAHLVLMVLMGLTGWAVLFFLDRSLCLAPLSLTAPFIYVQPVTTRALRFVLFHQNPDIPAMAGAVIVLGVMIWIFLKESHPREELAAAT